MKRPRILLLFRSPIHMEIHQVNIFLAIELKAKNSKILELEHYTDPIYVFGSSNHQNSDQTARMTQLYQAVNSVEVHYYLIHI